MVKTTVEFCGDAVNGPPGLDVFYRHAAAACWSFPVVSAVLSRSPVETRCDALEAILRQSNTRQKAETTKRGCQGSQRPRQCLCVAMIPHRRSPKSGERVRDDTQRRTFELALGA